MKIGIDISQIVYKGTGVASYTQNLTTALIHFCDANFVLFGSSLRRRQELENFVNAIREKKKVEAKIFSFPPTVLEMIWNKLHAINIESFTGKVDIFHSSDWTEPPSLSRKVTTVHDMIVFKYPQFLNSRIIETQKRKLEWVRKETSQIIADSESTKEDIKTYLKIPDQQIQVVYLGVSQNIVRQPIKKAHQVLKKYDIHPPFILSVGTREPRKNLDRTISAFQKLNLKDYSLVLIGNYGWGEKIDRSKNIHILEQLNLVDLSAFYTLTSCFVYPSLYEGFGLPVLEAMRCGAVVVTSNHGSLKEIAGKHATVVNPESVNSICEGIKANLNLTAAKKIQIQKRNIDYSQQFTWEKTAKKTFEVYKSLT